MSPKIELLNIDCLEYMKGVPDKYFELAIVDPPYGIGFDGEVEGMVTNNTSGKWRNAHGNGYARKEWDKAIPEKEYFKQLFRVSKNQIIWGGNYFELPASGGWIVWDKMRPYNFSSSQGELAWVRNSGRVTIFKYLYHGFQKEIQEQRIHPTQKPVKLYKWLLQNYATCNKCNNTGSFYEDVGGDSGTLVFCHWCEVAENGRPKILDTHGGSMSIAIACHQMGFDLTLCEIDKDYYDAGVKRFKEQTMQQSLFK